ncbi:MAG: hypothetical protein EON93_00810 [Burkholderiales bacterium]|nr:MAG: hypothetical protein EON93_00810 [Burkholderiales bacterium]
MKIRQLTDSGRQTFRDWLEQRGSGELPPQELLEGTDATEVVADVELDLTVEFVNRFEFGKAIAELLKGIEAKSLLSQKYDGLWDWLTVAYFAQFGRKTSRSWHYTVTRRGHSGSLAYRHLARTAFEMYWRHGVHSLVMLHVDMSTWGDLSEQLTSRQNVAYHRGYIQTANVLYLSGGKLKRGAAGRVRPAAKRKPGETTGRGGVGRLAIAVRRLCRTYDTHALEVREMLMLLPREFQPFIAKATGAPNVHAA